MFVNSLQKRSKFVELRAPSNDVLVPVPVDDPHCFEFREVGVIQFHSKFVEIDVPSMDFLRYGDVVVWMLFQQQLDYSTPIAIGQRDEYPIRFR